MGRGGPAKRKSKKHMTGCIVVRPEKGGRPEKGEKKARNGSRGGEAAS